MQSKIIDGKKIAFEHRIEIKDQIIKFEKTHDLKPCLAVILVGSSPASKLYVKNKILACKEVGISLVEYYYNDDFKEAELINLIIKLNLDSNIHGILVQLPLPLHINATKIINVIDPKKDVDGFTVNNFGKLVTAQDCFVPCTPQGCLILIKSIVKNLQGLRSVVLGRSNIVGKPMVHVLLQENSTVTIAHSYSENLPEICREADILVVAVGKEKLVNSTWVREGAIIIDVGINYNKLGKIIGDVDFESVYDKVKAISPVPGGVGPMTVTCLLKNTLKAALIQRSNV